jgi:hypothetical protein
MCTARRPNLIVVLDVVGLLQEQATFSQEIHRVLRMISVSQAGIISTHSSNIAEVGRCGLCNPEQAAEDAGAYSGRA